MFTRQARAHGKTFTLIDASGKNGARASATIDLGSLVSASDQIVELWLLTQAPQVQGWSAGWLHVNRPGCSLLDSTAETYPGGSTQLTGRRWKPISAVKGADVDIRAESSKTVRSRLVPNRRAETSIGFPPRIARRHGQNGQKRRFLGALVVVFATLCGTGAGVQALPTPPGIYVSPFTVTDVSPDAPYGTPDPAGVDPGGKINGLVLYQPPAGASGIAPPPTLWAAGQYGGVWRSIDGGRRWSHASRGIRFGVSRQDGTLGGPTLAFDSGAKELPRRLMFAAVDDDGRIGASQGGLYVSSNGGDSWEHVDLRAAAMPGTCPRTQELDISTVLFRRSRFSPRAQPYVATACGIFTTTDVTLRGGWSLRPTPPFQTFNAILAADATGTMFACRDAGLFESVDGGQSWIPTNAPSLGTGTCRGLAADPINGRSASRKVVEVSDFTACPASPTPLPPTCNYEVSTVTFSNSAGVADQRNLLSFPSETTSGCCGHPMVYTALRADRPANQDLPGLSYDIYASDGYFFAVLTGLASEQGTLIGSAQWHVIRDVHVDTWAVAASPVFYAPSRNACDVWMAVDGGVYQNRSGASSNGRTCTPGTGWARAMSGLHAFDTTSIVGAQRPQRACTDNTQPCPAVYTSSGDNDSWATAQARRGAEWGIMDHTLGDSGSTFLDPALPYMLVTGREGGPGCHLALYHSAAPQTPPVPGDQYDVKKGDRGSYMCIEPPLQGFGGLEPPGNAAFTQVRKLPSDPAGAVSAYIGVSTRNFAFPRLGSDDVVERRLATIGPTLSDTGWYSVTNKQFNPGQIAAVKAAGGLAHTVIYVLTQTDGHGFKKGHVYRGDENPARNFSWVDISGTAPATHVENAADMFVDPYDPDNIFVTDNKGQNIKETFDGGKRWHVDTQLTQIATGHGTFTYRCNDSNPGFYFDGCLLKDMTFVPAYPGLRIATTLPGGFAFSRDSGHHWIDLDLTNNGTSFSTLINPQPIGKAAGAFFDPTPNPRTHQPSLYLALTGQGVLRVDGPFLRLGAINFAIACPNCGAISIVDVISNKREPLTPDGNSVFRGSELIDLGHRNGLSFRVVAGPRTKRPYLLLEGGKSTSTRKQDVSRDERRRGSIAVRERCALTTNDGLRCSVVEG